jgi:hypothetical protein
VTVTTSLVITSRTDQRFIAVLPAERGPPAPGIRRDAATANPPSLAAPASSPRPRVPTTTSCAVPDTSADSTARSGPGQARPTDLATQHRDLVAQHHQLRDHRGLAHDTSGNEPNTRTAVRYSNRTTMPPILPANRKTPANTPREQFLARHRAGSGLLAIRGCVTLRVPAAVAGVHDLTERSWARTAPSWAAACSSNMTGNGSQSTAA